MSPSGPQYTYQCRAHSTLRLLCAANSKSLSTWHDSMQGTYRVKMQAMHAI
jgi:hypothetical protein